MNKILLFLVIISFSSCSTSSENILSLGENSVEEIVKIDSTSVEEEIQNIFNQKLDEAKLRGVIYKELNDFKNHKAFIQTKKFKVLIDQLQDGSYRYASWPKSKTISDEPDLILKGGTVDFQGSSGNHLYTFKNSNYIYTCFINVLGKKSKDAFLKVTQNEKVIVDHDATFISPFSKAIADSVMPFVLKNYQPGNNFYNQYDFVKLLFKSAIGGDMHPEGSSLNPSLEDRLGIISGIDLVLGHDEDYITYYNPYLFKWMILNLTPEPNLNIGNYTVSDYYFEKFAPFTRKLMSIYWNLENRGFEKEAMKYKEVYKNDNDVLYHLRSEYGTRVPDDEWVDGMQDNYFDINAELSGFLLRRYIHGTHDDIYDVLEFVLKKYDNYWFENEALLIKHDLDVESHEHGDIIGFLKRGFKLVNFKYSGNTQESNKANDDLNNDEELFEKIEYEFNDCDGNQLYEIFKYQVGDYVAKYIPNLSDSNLVQNGYINIDNPLPFSESSWDSNLEMTLDGEGELFGIDFNNRGMGGGYEISISRTDKSCILKYYGFAD
tara:strand:- start:193 stop:1833 length:1641 start_codon:yes stop_codon:yes gene_type:complete